MITKTAKAVYWINIKGWSTLQPQFEGGIILEKLSIDSQPFEIMKQQFDDMLQSTLKQIGGSDTAELNVKITFNTDFAGEETDALAIKWDITKTIKAKKYKVSGRPIEEPMIEVDVDGNILTYSPTGDILA